MHCKLRVISYIIVCVTIIAIFQINWRVPRKLAPNEGIISLNYLKIKGNENDSHDEQHSTELKRIANFIRIIIETSTFDFSTMLLVVAIILKFILRLRFPTDVSK